MIKKRLLIGIVNSDRLPEKENGETALPCLAGPLFSQQLVRAVVVTLSIPLDKPSIPLSSSLWTGQTQP